VTDWNFADVWDVVARSTPERWAVVQGEARLTWGDFERRSAGVARGLVSTVAGRHAKIALYLHNRPEYLETMYATFKSSLVPVNTNYRFGLDELQHLWSDSDAEIVVFDQVFTETAHLMRDRVPHVHTWVCVGDGAPEWAVAYEQWATQSPATEAPDRSGDDVFLLYTGGTTGLPKGVMWRQDDMFCNLNATALYRYPEDLPLDQVAEHLPTDPPVHLPAAPLMHGAGSITSMSALSQGGTVVLLPSRTFSAAEMLDAIENERVRTVTITGDAIGRPLAEALDAEPGRWDLSTVTYIVSSAVAFSAEVKQRIGAHAPHVSLVDTLGSSEGMGVGRSVIRHGRTATVEGDFMPSRFTQVLDEDGAPVEPGSGERGVLVVGGRQPLGYYNDPAKSDTVWRTINGKRYAVSGDYAEVMSDGSIKLLGRGSTSINSGGEKVFPAEVEDTIRSHAAVRDVAVVGVPDERFGQAVSALVELVPGESVAPEEIVRHVKERLAGFKAPRHVAFVPAIARLANGKLDYPSLHQTAREATTATETADIQQSTYTYNN
jgi:acyl-CoA synthetase (AMP-forming)/AMP-acid ligase II